MKQKQFERYVTRDGGCVHCGETETVSPHHRVNRGMGGSKLRDNAANIVVMCSLFNGLIESDEKSAHVARLYGWKLRPWEDATETPLWHASSRTWRLLQDDYSFAIVPTYAAPEELRDYF